jgi:hypothetical protein
LKFVAGSAAGSFRHANLTELLLRRIGLRTRQHRRKACPRLRLGLTPPEWRRARAQHRLRARATPANSDPARIAVHQDVILYFGCPDVDAAYAYLGAKGITAKKPKIAPYGMKQLYLTDPDGYQICFQWPADAWTHAKPEPYVRDRGFSQKEESWWRTSRGR